MRIVEYKLHRLPNGGKVTPDFIVDGGYFPVDGKYIGLIPDLPDFYVPPTTKENANADLVELDRTELKSRMVTAGMQKEDGTAMTQAEIEAYIDDWCNNKNIP